MASTRKKRPVRGRGQGNDARRAYGEFISDLLTGAISATKLYDTTEADGTVEIVVQTDEGPVTVVHPLRRLTSLEYDDPSGASRRGRPR